MLQDKYIYELDRVLEFAVKHTDEYGRMVVDGEIDCKDSGWLVLAAVIRLKYNGEGGINYPLESVVDKWTFASVDVDDRRSAWTTFALLYSIFLSGGKDGFFYRSLSDTTAVRLDRFIMQVDMQFLYDASRNYQVAAGIINTLRLQFGYISDTDIPPEDNIKVMLDAYLGNGFFNDDDNRGSGADRRIDAYSAEIIGLLLHYDEINQWNSKWHERIQEIVRDFSVSNLHLIDSNGEYAKWGRSLRGEAEAKKLFIWEYAENHELVASVGDGVAACLAQLGFFRENGIGTDGQIFRDKGGNFGIWDEYTTHVQAQGYGAYGLAMALHYAGKETLAASGLPAKSESYVRYLAGPQIVCANDHMTGMHCIIPLSNRLTKLMYLWHNRITGENDVSVDMSPKFMPIPYFGKQLAAPYADSRIPFLPLLEDQDGKLLVPRNLNPEIQFDTETIGRVRCIQHFAYCYAAEFEKATSLELISTLMVTSNALEYSFELTGAIQEFPGSIYFYIGDGDADISGSTACVQKKGTLFSYCFYGVDVDWSRVECGPSIYGGNTKAICAKFPVFSGLCFNYKFSWEKI